MALGLFANFTEGFGLRLNVDPKLAGGFIGVFCAIVNPSIVFLVDDRIEPSVALRMKLNETALTQMVSVLLKITRFKMPRLLGQN